MFRHDIAMILIEFGAHLNKLINRFLPFIIKPINCLIDQIDILHFPKSKESKTIILVELQFTAGPQRRHH